MEQKVIMAGFGGQGIMAIGKLLAYAGMLENRNVTWMPSYGPEMRGGTANCAVVVSDDEVGSPLISRDGTAAIVMNLPSMTKFEKELVTGGKLIINKSLIDAKPTRTDIDAYYVNANELAMELGNAKVANMVMLGAYLELAKTIETESVLQAFVKVFGEEKSHLVPLNKEALIKGAEAVKA
ncbi:2-oxoacid:acceptor oxidoreductase family protein [Sedimentibacter hydroxybenzoicus DSM 7310]|uniref:2-oxoacid:acceptor oxidoreductase family protein n=1 Tax=Sedimentibacter hydroxybenzoicus DSM 7310 TaxID=1123245 RepID=A0A974BMF2_SEDHY|nr:2-oxoacid:acceptor oxidoreductase family protein [Sedimentibacter hydroxybenzoicus]NYB75511.1 2-oxoacid:acceptor oxidoreductase family protein [Sedimentibacter hydroxybenzoicus DSM 7310]